jgi:hypothetical protein
MRGIVAIGSLLMVISCGDSAAPVGDQRAPDRASLDASHREAGATDQRPAEARTADQPRIDLKRGPDTAYTPDGKPGSLQVTIVSANVWANMMPPVGPDPTGVALKLSLVNSGGQDVTGLKLTSAELRPTNGAAQAIDLVAVAPFAGVVTAGNTVTADFSKVKKTTSTPMPTSCNGTLKLAFSVQHDGGTLGPFSSGDLTLVCAY